MKTARFTSRLGVAGFTLVELLTAITILSLLVLMFTQIISLVGQSTSMSFRRADAYGEARTILDRFGIDWEARSRRSDLAPTFSAGTGTAIGNDAVIFYSQVNGFGSATRSVSQVGYYVTNSPYSLQRSDSGTTWATSNALLFWTPTAAVNPGTFPSANYQTLGDDVCRLQFCFQLKSTGKLVATQPASFGDVGAVVAAIAVLDKTTRKQVNAAQIATLVSTLTKAPNGTTPQDEWTSNLQTVSAGILPTPITQNVRIYQRTFYAN